MYCDCTSPRDVESVPAFIVTHIELCILNWILNYWVSGLPSIVWNSKHKETQRLGNWICFRPQVRGGETPTLLGPSDRANLNHWTMDQVQKPSNSWCCTPSSESFRFYLNWAVYILQGVLWNSVEMDLTFHPGTLYWNRTTAVVRGPWHYTYCPSISQCSVIPSP
jgi:hypothetical protein